MLRPYSGLNVFWTLKRQTVSQVQLLIVTKLHGVISQKIVILIQVWDSKFAVEFFICLLSVGYLHAFVLLLSYFPIFYLRWQQTAKSASMSENSSRRIFSIQLQSDVNDTGVYNKITVQ